MNVDARPDCRLFLAALDLLDRTHGAAVAGGELEPSLAADLDDGGYRRHTTSAQVGVVALERDDPGAGREPEHDEGDTAPERPPSTPPGEVQAAGRRDRDR